MPKNHARLLTLAASLVAIAALAGCAGNEESTDDGRGNGNDGDEVNNGSTVNDTFDNDTLGNSSRETGNASANDSLYSPP